MPESPDRIAPGHNEDRIERSIELEAPLSRVWKALTDYREFGEWFRVKIDSPFVPGKASTGHITHPGYEHLQWEVLVQKIEPEHTFSFTWHPYAIDPKIDYSKEPPTLVQFHLGKHPLRHASDCHRNRLRQNPGRTPRRGIPDERWRLGRANEEH